MATASKSFTATGIGTPIGVSNGQSFTYDVSGTFVGTVELKRTTNGGLSYEPGGQAGARVTATGSASGTIEVQTPDRGNASYVWFCTDFTSGTIVTTIVESVDVTQTLAPGLDAVDGGYKVTGTLQATGAATLASLTVTGASTFTGVATLNEPIINRASQKRIQTTGAYAGQTAGWLVGTLQLTNIGTAALLPASQTASNLIMRIDGLKVGDTITGFHLIGQVESAGGAVTLDADLRKVTAVAADNTDASIGAITQIAVTADTKISLSNSTKTLVTPEVVAADETFYVLLAGTTAAATDIALNGIAIIVTEA